MIYIGYDKTLGGIGDFLYILFQYYFFSNERLYHIPELKIYIPEHPLKYCVECIYIEPPFCEKIHIIASSYLSEIFTEHIYNNHKYIENDIIIYSNMNDFLHLMVRHCNKSKLSVLKREFRENIFRITPFMKEYTENIKQKSGITKKYAALHIRCGDKYLLNKDNNKDDRCSPDNNITERKFILGLEFLKKINPNIPICIFCDNHSYKKYLAEKYNCFYFYTKIIHTAAIENNNRDSAIFDTFAEFILLSESTTIFAITTSNFSRVPAFIFDISFYSFNSEENLNIIKYNEI